MDTWTNANGNQYEPRPHVPHPVRSFSGETMSRTAPRKPLISFSRSASLASTTPARGLPIPPPLPPLPPGIFDRQPESTFIPESIHPLGYSTPRRPLVNFASKTYSAPNDQPRSPPLPPKPLSRFVSFGKGFNTSSSSRSNSPPPPVVPPRPVTSHGARTLPPTRDRPPAVPFRPHVLVDSPISDYPNGSWSAISSQRPSDHAWLTHTPTFDTPPPPYGYHHSPQRPHTALPSSHYGTSFDRPTTAPRPPPPPPSGTMPVLKESNDSEHPQMDTDLAHALNLSLAESAHKSRTQKQEDAELAKAIAESLALSKPNHSDKNGNINTRLINARDGSSGSGANCSRVVDSSSPETLQIPNMAGKSYLEMNSPYEKDLETPSSLFLEMDDPGSSTKASETDEEFVNHLQKEETRQMAADILNREDIARRDAEMTKKLQENARKQEEQLVERENQDRKAAEKEGEVERSLSHLRRMQEERDAELARMMAKWEEHGQVAESTTLPLLPKSPPRLPTQPLPFDDEARPSPRPKSSHDRTARSAPIGAPPVPNLGNKASLIMTKSQNIASVQSETSVSRSHSGSSTIGKESTSGSSHIFQFQPPNSESSRDPSPGPSSRDVSAEHPPPSTSRGVNGKAVADESADLRGFSYGFTPPNIPVSPPQATLACAPFPDIINLSPTPYPPFHIMAPSWRHLLRLLAGQETRIQAHIDVLANRKEEQKLRVVVQFVRLAYTANTWRTIIHLTLDEPFPPTVPASATARFTNGDTNVLPYSYAISDHGRYMSDPKMHIYAIPLSPTSPFPILPITFPKLALYLQSAMKDSRARKVRHDSFRRLAKIVQSCYPEEVMPPVQEEKKPSRGVGNLIKRVVRRGNSSKQEVTGNEDVFDMITPFRLDQYTTTSSSATSP